MTKPTSKTTSEHKRQNVGVAIGILGLFFSVLGSTWVLSSRLQKIEDRVEYIPIIMDSVHSRTYRIGTLETRVAAIEFKVDKLWVKH